MFPTILTGPAFEAAIREQAVERPDHTYEPKDGSCLYVHWTQDAAGVLPKAEPGCIVGSALMRLGYPAEWLSVAGGVHVLLGHLQEYGVKVEVPIEVKDWASKVQNHQDNREPWGQAVQNTDRTIIERLREDNAHLKQERDKLYDEVWVLREKVMILTPPVKGPDPELERLLAEEEEER